VGESSFWYRPTRVVPDQRPLNGRCCCLKRKNKTLLFHNFIVVCEVSRVIPYDDFVSGVNAWTVMIRRWKKTLHSYVQMKRG